MPMFNLNSDEPEESIISFQAGEKGTLGLVRRGEENATVNLHKGEKVTLWWEPDRGEDAWSEEADEP